MTAKTGKDTADRADIEAAEVEAAEDAAAEDAAAETARTAARPAKRKRRVRVIEVIDDGDGDLDQVLEALDAEDDAADDEEEPPARPARAATKATAGSAAKTEVKTEPRPARLEPPDAEADSADEAEDAEADSADEAAEPKRKKPIPRPAAAAEAPRPGPSGLPLVPMIVVVVLVALLASLGIWQWRTASSLSSEKGDREAIGKVATAYGDAAYTYNTGNYEAQSAKVEKLMAGDLLDDYKKTVLPSLAGSLQADPQLSLTAKSNQVFVGSVNGSFATAVVMLDLTLKTKDGTVSQPATLLRLSLGKIDGEWKVTEQFASGVNEQNKNQGQLPVPGGGSASPKPSGSEKPGN